MASRPRRRWKRPPPAPAADDPLTPMIKLLAQLSLDEWLKEQPQPQTEAKPEAHDGETI
jgi:hypothetical protein